MTGSGSSGTELLNPRRSAIPHLMMGVALCLVMLAAISIGSVSVQPKGVLEAVLRGIGALPGTPDGNDRIIFHIRVPRVLLAALVGGVLGLCGAVMQGLFRNPMADPGVLGISSGAGLGAVVAISLGHAASNTRLLPLFAAVGSLAATGIIFLLAARRGMPATALILSGMAVSMLFGALTTGILSFSRSDQVKQFLFWTSGSLNGTTWESLQVSAAPMLVCVCVLLAFSRDLNVLSLGEEQARAVGMHPARIRLLLLSAVAIAAAAAVSVSGVIGFVGLMVPHILRLLLGPDHRRLLPASLLGGAVLLVFCDLLGRTLFSPRELGVGIVTAAIGSPYLLLLLVRGGRKGGTQP